MSMKKTDLVKQLAKKLDGRMKSAGVPGRFAQGAAEVVDRREQRRRDAAAGLVPFACKLPAGLLKRLDERAGTSEGGANAFVAEALERALADAPSRGAGAGSNVTAEPSQPTPRRPKTPGTAPAGSDPATPAAQA